MKKGKIIVSILSILILFGCASGMYAAVYNIDEKKLEVKIDYNKQFSNAEIIPDTIYVLSDSLIKDNDTTPYDRFGQSNVALSKDDKKFFNSEFNSWYQILMNEPNIKYQAMDTKTQNVISNVDVDLFSIMKEANTQKEYQWLIKIDFDENGKATFTLPIEDSIDKDNKETRFLNQFENFKVSVFDSYFFYDEESYGSKNNAGEVIINNSEEGSLSDGDYIDVSLKSPKNVSMVLAIPTKLTAHGELYYNSLYFDRNEFHSMILPFMLITIAVVILFTLFAPIRYFKEMAVFKNLMKIKLGFLLIAGIGAGIGLFVSMIELLNGVVSGQLVEWLNKTNWSFAAELIEFLFVVSIWALFLFLIMFATYIIKYIFDKGLFKFIKENTVFGWLYFNFMKIVDKVMNFDLDDPTNRAVLKVVVFNFIIITVISFFFAFGFIFAFIYSILLFVLLRNKLNNIKYDYEVLLRATRKISNGEFDVEIKEDLGVFNSLRDEFSNIKDGFEKAVNEEVKSQRMKTELISNVSHDLKTPLTSIITYVDLLKNTDLSLEQRSEYIATIDRNSLRLKNLIDDLFEVSKVNSGNVKLNLIDVDIVSLIKQAYFENVDRMKEKELDFKMNFSDEKIVYSLDSSKTYRIFENLLVNISKYALANTRVYIDVQNYDNRVVITFKNISENEISIDENELTERFVQGDTSRNTGGSGLGLAIAKSFTELQGGTFKVEIDGDLFKAIVTLKR